MALERWGADRLHRHAGHCTAGASQDALGHPASQCIQKSLRSASRHHDEICTLALSNLEYQLRGITVLHFDTPGPAGMMRDI